jgi:uncharacterized protein YggE
MPAITVSPKRTSQVAALLLSGALFLSTGFAQAQAQPQTDFNANTILTTGQGEVKALPDSLNVNFTVESEAPTLNEARTKTNTAIANVLKAIKALNVPNATLTTTQLQVYPIQRYEENNRRLPKTIGYKATNGVRVSVTRMASDQLSATGTKIVDAALNNGANRMDGIWFFRDDMQSLKDQALAKAVTDARHSATIIAQTAGVGPINLYSLENHSSGGYQPPMPMMATMAARAKDAAEAVPESPVEIGEITVTSNVTARFKF